MDDVLSIGSDDSDDYNPTDSDDGYTEKERNLLQKATKRVENVDSEEEVYGINSDSSADEIADSDIENTDYLPDDRAWGKKKRTYYHTDYVDPDTNVFQAKDVDAAQFEEEEARKIQQRLLEQIDEDDFSLDIFNVKNKEKKSVKEESNKIKTDIESLLDTEKKDIILKESPEFLGLIDEFKEKCTEITTSLGPILDLVSQKELDENLEQYVRLKYSISMRYLMYINFYLLLKSLRVNIKYHPVVKEIIKFRDFYNQLESVNNETLKQKLANILLSPSKVKKSKKLLKALKKKKNVKIEEHTEQEEKKSKKNKKRKMEKLEEPEEKTKKVHFAEENLESLVNNLPLNELDNNSNKEVESQDEAENVNEMENEKRAITYQMAKNKGLTPRRKKEQRNPRVKHRNKFRKATIRRKGAVREVRKELSRYSGEISGIKATVTKSIKIK